MIVVLWQESQPASGIQGVLETKVTVKEALHRKAGGCTWPWRQRLRRDV